MSRPARSMLAAVLPVCLLALLAGTPPVAAQAERIPWGHATHAFRLIMHDLGFQPLRSVAECAAQPESTIVIAHGETEQLDKFPGGIRSFVERGGALLIATDRARPHHRTNMLDRWEYEFSVTISENLVEVVDGDLNNAYRQSASCPIIRPDEFPSPLLRGVKQGVATNRPACLHLRSSSIGARFPEGCSSVTLSRRRRTEPPVFAAGRDWGRGRLLVLADHSVFINDMMLQTDNDNILFATNCLEWLREERGKRTQVLFIEEGAINSEFNVPVAEPPIPPPGPWINHLIQGLEEENVFNRTVLAHITVGKLLRALVVALTVLLILYGLVRLFRARHRVESAALPLAVAVNRQVALRAVLHQRHQDMLRADNLWEAARTLAQECLAPVVGKMDNVRPLPRIEAQGGWWQRRTLRHKVERLWKLAFGAKPVRVTAHEFVELVRQMEEVKAALARGSLAISA